MLDRIPTDKDWEQYLDDFKDEAEFASMERPYAREKFAGKSVEEAVSVLKSNEIIVALEEFFYIPRIPFRYYIFALRDYVLSDDLLEDEFQAASAGSGYLGLIFDVMTHYPETLRPVIDELMPSMEYVAANQSRYFADPDIYGAFNDKLEEIKSLATTIK